MKRFKKFKNDRITIILAVILGIATWVYVINEVNPIITREFRNIPVKMLNIDDLEKRNLMVMNPKEPTISVSLRGYRNTLNRVQDSSIIAEVDLLGFEEGIARASVSVTPPGDTNIYDVSDRDLLFTVEELVEKKIPIQKEILEGTAGDDLRYDISTEVANVSFIAPRSVANQVHQAKILVDVKDKKESFTKNEKIQLLDSDNTVVSGIEYTPEIVSASIEVSKVKIVPIVISHSGVLEKDITIVNEKIEPNQIRIVGPPSVVDKINQIYTESIAYEDIKESGKLSVNIQIPTSVKVDDEVNLIYTYTVRNLEKKEIFIPREKIQIRNLPSNLSGKIAKGNDIVLELIGDELILAGINEDSIKIFVDGKSLNKGNHDVSIEMDELNQIKSNIAEIPKLLVIVEELE